jgi:hypothetical protein
LLIGNDLAESLGDIQDIRFWPRLEGTQGRKYVESDVLLSFKESLLMVDVKPPFGGDQTEAQWLTQVESLVRQRELDDVPQEVPAIFHFLALGNNTPQTKQSEARLSEIYADQGLNSVRSCEWEDVRRGISDLLEAESGRDLYISKDWIAAFELYGLIEPPKSFTNLSALLYPRIANWYTAMRKFEVNDPALGTDLMDWQTLADLANTWKLKVRAWL